jgi:hypothetical protein
MALEDRVAVLEDQMKILTNEIQSILLDIEEQVLAHYFPELRPDESSFPGSAPRTLSATRRYRAEEAPVEPIYGSTAPSSGRVHRELVGKAQPSVSALAQPPLRSGEVTEYAFTELVDWMGRSIDRIGPERTEKVIEGYARDGHLSMGSRDILFQLVSLAEENDSPPVVSMKEMLDVLAELNEVLGRGTDVAEVQSLLEETGIG